MTNRTYIPDVVEISTAARLSRAGVFVDGQRIGTTPDGYPVWSRHGSVLVDMRPSPSDELPEDTAAQNRVQPEFGLVGMAKPRRARSRKGGWSENT